MTALFESLAPCARRLFASLDFDLFGLGRFGENHESCWPVQQQLCVCNRQPLGVAEFSTVDDLVGAIAAYFPKVQGEVNTVQGDKVTITLGRKDGVTSGMTLTLWRVAKEILHPVTNAVIGRTEEEVGTVEVSKVSEKESTAMVIKKQKEPRAGDKARITPRKISLAVVPLQATAPEVLELSQQLAESGSSRSCGQDGGILRTQGGG
jgi:hypothetical protein